METDILKSVASLGVGALFGIVVYFMSLREHRASRQQLIDLVAANYKVSERREEILQELIGQAAESRDKNTEALTKLATIIERIEIKLK